VRVGIGTILEGGGDDEDCMRIDNEKFCEMKLKHILLYRRVHVKLDK
jgi:hypothetical protein